MKADAGYAPDDPVLKPWSITVGHEKIIIAAIPKVRMAGIIGVYGVLGSPHFTLDKEKGPYNFNLLNHQWPNRDADCSAQEPLIIWIREELLDWRDFVNGKYHVTEFVEAFFKAVSSPSSIKTRLIMDTWSLE